MYISVVSSTHYTAFCSAWLDCQTCTLTHECQSGREFILVMIAFGMTQSRDANRIPTGRLDEQPRRDEVILKPLQNISNLIIIECEKLTCKIRHKLFLIGRGDTSAKWPRLVGDQAAILDRFCFCLPRI